MAKRILCMVLATVLCVSTLFSLTSCSALPELDTVKDRFIYLIEESKQLNTIFFGVGLPVYDREGALSLRRGIYYEDELPSYNTLTNFAPYYNIDGIKQKAESVFSAEYLELIYEGAFKGVLSAGHNYLRFYEFEGKLYQSQSATNFNLSERIYDYSTMQIVKPSNNEYINITVQSYTVDDPRPRTVSLSFIFQRGDWYLDTPTY